MVVPTIRITTENVAELGENLVDSQHWVARFTDSNMEGLGRRIAFLMRLQIRPHKVSGALEESVISVYEKAGMKLQIGPTRKYRGGWDAGLILQRGTKPIPNLPFAPIAAWAGFRGLPAGPIWMSIKTKGVKAHPFLDETLARGDVSVAIRNTARRIGVDLAGAVVQKI
ncbi:hypothetical protein LCGC14_3003470, partial [marine sediment metagenome]